VVRGHQRALWSTSQCAWKCQTMAARWLNDICPWICSMLMVLPDGFKVGPWSAGLQVLCVDVAWLSAAGQWRGVVWGRL
jgi:hypothetical protein